MHCTTLKTLATNHERCAPCHVPPLALAGREVLLLATPDGNEGQSTLTDVLPAGYSGVHTVRGQGADVVGVGAHCGTVRVMTARVQHVIDKQGVIANTHTGWHSCLQGTGRVQ